MTWLVNAAVSYRISRDLSMRGPALNAAIIWDAVISIYGGIYTQDDYQSWRLNWEKITDAGLFRNDSAKKPGTTSPLLHS